MSDKKKGKRHSRNALVHGLYSNEVLLPWESKKEFEELHQGLRAEFRPHGCAEEEAVLDLAFAYWKKRTLWRMQKIAVLNDAYTSEIAETKSKSWYELRKELRAKNRHAGSVRSIATDTMSMIRSQMQNLLLEIAQTSDREEIKKLDAKMDAYIRVLSEHAVPVIQIVNQLPNAEKAFDNIYQADNMEKIVRLEAALDSRIAKILSRFVGLKEFKRTPAGGAVAQLVNSPNTT